MRIVAGLSYFHGPLLYILLLSCMLWFNHGGLWRTAIARTHPRIRTRRISIIFIVLSRNAYMFGTPGAQPSLAPTTGIDACGIYGVYIGQIPYSSMRYAHPYLIARVPACATQKPGHPSREISSSEMMPRFN